MNQISLAWREDPSGMLSLDVQIAFTYLCQVLIMPSPGEMSLWDNDCQLIWLPDNTIGKKIRHSSDFLTSPDTSGEEIHPTYDFLTAHHTSDGENRPSSEILTRSNPYIDFWI